MGETIIKHGRTKHGYKYVAYESDAVIKEVRCAISMGKNHPLARQSSDVVAERLGLEFHPMLFYSAGMHRFIDGKEVVLTGDVVLFSETGRVYALEKLRDVSLALFVSEHLEDL